jgi:predicted dinucleotide-binding enzyme
MSTTTIGILGAGRVGLNLARRLALAGHDVVVGRRDPAAPLPDQARDLTVNVRFTDQRTAAAAGDVVINATPGDTALERLGALADELAGKILVDIANATHHGPDGLPGDLVYQDGSLGERLQRALPATRVVKTLNTMLYVVMTAPESLTTPPTVYLSGDDQDAKDTVARLLGDLGWKPDWIEDIGDITTARATEAVILMVTQVLRHKGFQPVAVSLSR